VHLIGLHVTPEAALFHGGIVAELKPSVSGVVVIATASAQPVLTFRNFSLRCDKSNPEISFETSWDWECGEGKRIAVITNNSFLRYQLIACMSGLISPVSGEILGNSVIGWPVGGEGGLDRKLRISHAVNFLSSVYRDCLDNSLVSIDQFWKILSEVGIEPGLVIKDLARDQKDFFALALSVLFSFDCYLIPKTRFLMSKPAKTLKELLLKQLEGKMLFATSTNVQFQREFCTDGVVLGPLGQMLFVGKLPDAIQWADENLGDFNIAESEDDVFDDNPNFRNSEISVDQIGGDF